MRGADRILSVLMLLLGSYVLATSFRLGYTMDDLPGPGFAPFWAGLALVAISLSMLAGTFSRSKDNRSTPLSRESLRNLVVSLGGCVALVVLTRFIGFLTALGLLTVLLVRFWGIRSWVTTILVAVILPVLLHFLFVTGFGVPVPKGILGF